MPLTHTQPDALSRVYAQAINELAIERGGQQLAENVVGELEEIVELARGDARFSELLSSRIIQQDKRAESISRIFKGRVLEETLSTLQVLNEKGRLSHLPAITEALDQLVQSAFGRIEVDVYTAAPATSEELETIRERLRQSLGKEPVMHSYVDAKMIGGVKLQIGDRLLDGSVATRLRKMRDQINTIGAARLRAGADRMIGE